MSEINLDLVLREFVDEILELIEIEHYTKRCWYYSTYGGSSTVRVFFEKEFYININDDGLIVIEYTARDSVFLIMDKIRKNRKVLQPFIRIKIHDPDLAPKLEKFISSQWDEF